MVNFVKIVAGNAYLQTGINEILSVFSTSYLICIICAEDVLQKYILLIALFMKIVAVKPVITEECK